MTQEKQRNCTQKTSTLALPLLQVSRSVEDSLKEEKRKEEKLKKRKRTRKKGRFVEEEAGEGNANLLNRTSKGN